MSYVVTEILTLHTDRFLPNPEHLMAEKASDESLLDERRSIPQEQNRLVAKAFSMTTLLDLEPAVDSCSMLFIQKLGIYGDNEQPVDLGARLYVR
jgi:hypothetical protein